MRMTSSTFGPTWTRRSRSGSAHGRRSQPSSTRRTTVAELIPLDLWYTDRSRYETGTGHCQRARYLQYHAGPHGYGWAPRASSVPLVTGIMLAEIQEQLHRY